MGFIYAIASITRDKCDKYYNLSYLLYKVILIITNLYKIRKHKAECNESKNTAYLSSKYYCL